MSDFTETCKTLLEASRKEIVQEQDQLIAQGDIAGAHASAQKYFSEINDSVNSSTMDLVKMERQNSGWFFDYMAGKKNRELRKRCEGMVRSIAQAFEHEAIFAEQRLTELKKRSTAAPHKNA